MSNRVFEWFSKNDSLYIGTDPKVKNDDFLKVILASMEEEKDRACLTLALEEFEKTTLIKSRVSKNGVYYFLVKPFQAYEQTVQIDSNLAKGIADFINLACEQQKDLTDFCDSSKINSRDIKNLFFLAAHYASKNGVEK